MTRKILTIIFSVIIIGVFAFLLTWGIINWSKVKEGMAGNGLYTQEDVNNAYEDGYNTALTDKDEYDKLISDYRDTITTLTDNISQLNSEISALNRTNNSLELQITNLTILKEELEEQLEKLSSESTENAVTIADLNRQILALNTEIDTLRLQVQNHSAVVGTLNKTIADLQASIEYYEQYIATLETGETVVATFEFDGKVYSIQIVTKGSTVTIADPPSTEGVIFNGWTVNGQPVTLSEYPLNANTKFVADVSYKYVVSFSVDGVVKSTQLVDKGQYAETPTSPKKANYTFKYWTLDGNLEVEIDKYPITCDTTFIAKFARLYTVTFQYEDGTEIVSRRIEEGTTTNAPRMSDLADNEILNGWKVNGYFVEVSSYVIYQDTTFVADISIALLDTWQEIEMTGLESYLYVKYIFTFQEKTYYCYDGKIYVFEPTNNHWRLLSSNFFNVLSTIGGFWTDGVNMYYSGVMGSSASHYVLDLSKDIPTYSSTTWNGLDLFDGNDVFMFNGEVYYHGLGIYKLNLVTRTWSLLSIEGAAFGFSTGTIWSDGERIYAKGFLDKKWYVVDLVNLIVEAIEWNIEIDYGWQVWTDGTNTYFSDDTQQYILDKSTYTWVYTSWKGITPNSGLNIWTDGERIYYHGGTDYVLTYSA